MTGTPLDSTSRIALVTSRFGLEVDADLPLLVTALSELGVRADPVLWDDPEADWAAFDLAVIRSTWDYSWRIAEFVAWAERCSALTRLANPVDVVRWNTDKRYLGELARNGVPVVPTRYFAPGDTPELPADGEYVIKPTAGAGSRFAARYRAGERDTALRHLARMHGDGLTAMVQPYVANIDVTGERAVLFCGGRYLHAIRKAAVLEAGVAYDADKVAHPSLEAWEPTVAELDVAARALAAVPGAPELLYARVDLVDGDDGQPCVMELELVEPNLFLSAAHPASLPVVAEMIAKAAADVTR